MLNLNLYQIVNTAARDLKPSANDSLESTKHDGVVENAVEKVEMGEFKARK